MKKHSYKKYLCFMLLWISLLFTDSVLFITKAEEIKLNETKINLFLGVKGQDNFIFQLENVPKSTKISWSSSNKKVAYIHPSTGKVTAKSIGTVTITGKVTLRTGKTSYQAKVIVSDNIKNSWIYFMDDTIRPNVLEINKKYSLCVGFHTYGGSGTKTTSKNYFTVLTEDKRATSDAVIDEEGNLTLKKAGTYYVQVQSFESESVYKEWKKNPEKYKNYILATADKQVTAIKIDYPLNTVKLGKDIFNYPKEFICKKDADSLVITREEKDKIFQSNIHIIATKQDEVMPYHDMKKELEASITENSAKVILQEIYKTKNVEINNLRFEDWNLFGGSILKISYDVSILGIGYKDIFDDLVTFDIFYSLYLYSFYKNNIHYTVAVLDAGEHSDIGFVEAAESLIQRFIE